MPDLKKVLKGLTICTKPGTKGCYYDIKECPYDGEGGCRIAMMRDALELLKRQEPVKGINVPCKWISVKDRLPEKDGRYIVYGMSDAMRKILPKCKPVWECRWCESCGGWYILEAQTSVDFITHWMPLPEPPEEERR